MGSLFGTILMIIIAVGGILTTISAVRYYKTRLSSVRCSSKGLSMEIHQADQIGNGSLITSAGAGLGTFLGAYTIDEWLAITGIIVTILTFVVGIIFKWLNYRLNRTKVLHEMEMERLERSLDRKSVLELDDDESDKLKDIKNQVS